MKILITGAQGMLGQDLVKVFSSAGHDVIAASRADLDITNQESVDSYIDKLKPEMIVNAAAYNAVDQIEEDEHFERAMQINARGPLHLAQAADRVGAKFVHFGTDYVFDGQGNAHYLEDDQTNPISRYGESKLKGEELAQNACDDTYICRVSKLFGMPGGGESAKENFVSLMFRLNQELDDLKIADEEHGCPAYSPDVAQVTLDLIEGDYDPGIYHIVNEGEPVTVYGFAKEIFDMAGVTDNFRPVPRSDYPRAANCPSYAPLKNTKLPKLRHRDEALREFLEKLGKI
ncbi:dTDP-4-dehydrorhamnose reductase [Candidatus Uhrbacteria bacterium]|jgi:dTDP-4-dehydrorhamnose reductase|nr:dTDP-4-dehydrorhamnose reductase [Candidatus Uhrbacteria bacterium]MBT7717588.1 dTDP-4-dehydrorhamnose reductase [Candidatus Uhrbacteria bacterium]